MVPEHPSPFWTGSQLPCARLFHECALGHCNHMVHLLMKDTCPRYPNTSSWMTLAFKDTVMKNSLEQQTAVIFFNVHMPLINAEQLPIQETSWGAYIKVVQVLPIALSITKTSQTCPLCFWKKVVACSVCISWKIPCILNEKL